MNASLKQVQRLWAAGTVTAAAADGGAGRGSVGGVLGELEALPAAGGAAARGREAGEGVGHVSPCLSWSLACGMGVCEK